MEGRNPHGRYTQRRLVDWATDGGIGGADHVHPEVPRRARASGSPSRWRDDTVRTARRSILALVLVASSFIAQAGVAHADPGDEVKRYDLATESGGDWGAVVLRQGTDTWGLQHIANNHGWPDPSDNCIQQTLLYYNRTEPAGSSVTYLWDYAGDFGTYRVVVEYGGDQGIITAYSSESPEKCWW
jgi:hypothetical protein